MCDCGEVNIPGHTANECKNKLIDEERMKYVQEYDKLYEIMNVNNQNNLKQYLHHTYYTLDAKIYKKCLKNCTKIMKEVVYRLIIGNLEDKPDKEESGPK